MKLIPKILRASAIVWGCGGFLFSANSALAASTLRRAATEDGSNEASSFITPKSDEGGFIIKSDWGAKDESPQNSLPQSSVIAMTLRRDGYLWLGTRNGLVRFDGIRFTVFDQHNTPGLKMIDDAVWTPDVGALQSSSYMKLPAIMHWFTGNIGYHHVHHLNPAVPFYRLPEAMAAVFELQAPVVTTLGFRDILASLRLKLWDEGSQQMVSFRQAARLPLPN